MERVIFAVRERSMQRGPVVRTVPLLLTLAVTLLVTTVTQAQFGNTASEDASLGAVQTEQWLVGMRVTANGGPCAGLVATLPVPIDWPEQTVRVVKEDVSPQVKSVQYRTLAGGVKQMIISIPRLPAGERAQALITFEIDRRQILAPEETSGLKIPERPDRDVRKYLGPSPYIESRHPQIRDLASELKDESLTPWEQVEKYYDWVRENVTYENGELKGARAALRDKTGDCDELTS